MSAWFFLQEEYSSNVGNGTRLSDGRKCILLLRPSNDIGMVPNIISPSDGGSFWVHQTLITVCLEEVAIVRYPQRRRSGLPGLP